MIVRRALQVPHTLIGCTTSASWQQRTESLTATNSGNAVNALEGVLLDEYPGDERFVALAEALALYAPRTGSPYLGRPEIKDAMRKALDALNAEHRPLMAADRGRAW
jgi:hypothetical protein